MANWRKLKKKSKLNKIGTNSTCVVQNKLYIVDVYSCRIFVGGEYIKIGVKYKNMENMVKIIMHQIMRGYN